ncbi:MAG TPA: protein phosphatase 2C domain-containing protein [Ktedonobacteraceae bacterium]
MSTQCFMSRIRKSPGRFTFALLLGALLALPCLVPAVAFARANAQAGAFSLSSVPTSVAVLNETGVSVLRLTVTYSGHPGENALTCTGLGVLVASQSPSLAPTSYTNWVLTDGNLVSTRMSTCGQVEGGHLTLNKVEIWASSEYAGSTRQQKPLDTLTCSKEVIQALDCGDTLAVSTLDTAHPSYTLLTFQSKHSQPYLGLASLENDTPLNVGLIKTQVGIYPSKDIIQNASTGAFQEYLTPSIVGKAGGNTVPNSGSSSATATSNTLMEGGTPELDGQGQLVGLWVNNGAGSYTSLTLATLQKISHDHGLPNVLLAATSSSVCSVASCWERGITEISAAKYIVAHPYLHEAYVLNSEFMAAQTFDTQALKNGAGGPNSGGNNTGPLSLVTQLFQKYPWLLPAVIALGALLLLLLVVLVWRSLGRRRKLALMANEWQIAQERAKQEVSQQKSQAGAPVPPPVQWLAPACPNCHNPVQLTDTICPNCHFALTSPSSAQDVRLVGSAPLVAPPPLSEQPTVMIPPNAPVSPVPEFNNEMSAPRAPFQVYEEPTQAIQQMRGHNLSLAVGTRTDPGIKRKHKPNEDSMFAYRYDTPSQQFGLFVVADGMGGHANGQDASRQAIQTMINFMLPRLTSGESKENEAFLKMMENGVQASNQAVHNRNMESHADMGTTMTAALVIGAMAYVANVGDSRTYLYREGQGLSKVTHDHSVVASLVDAGIIKPDDIYTHPKRNQIYRSLGEKPVVEVDTFQVNLQPGDKLMLCSDGLWDMVRDPLIRDVLSKTTKDPNKTGQDLIKAALDGGGEDNVSVIIVQFAEMSKGTSMSGVQLLARPDSVIMPDLPVV